MTLEPVDNSHYRTVDQNKNGMRSLGRVESIKNLHVNSSKSDEPDEEQIAKSSTKSQGQGQPAPQPGV